MHARVAPTCILTVMQTDPKQILRHVVANSETPTLDLSFLFLRHLLDKSKPINNQINKTTKSTRDKTKLN